MCTKLETDVTTNNIVAVTLSNKNPQLTSKLPQFIQEFKLIWHTVPDNPISQKMRNTNKVVTKMQTTEKVFTPLHPSQRPPNPETNAPNNGNSKISKYIVFL